MSVDRIPRGLVPSSGSLNLTDETMPDALRQEHALGPEHWGVLHVFEGSIRFVDMASDEVRVVSAPDLITIHPESPHRVETDGPLRCRIDFFRELEAGDSMRTPGEYADRAVRLSFERCEANGNFGEVFYSNFLKVSPNVAPYFAATDFERQRKVLRDSVHLLATRDVSDPETREMLDRLGSTHSRDGRNVLPELYEVWLDSICETVATLDPEWDDELERMWRVRLRAGMQIITAAY